MKNLLSFSITKQKSVKVVAILLIISLIYFIFFSFNVFSEIMYFIMLNLVSIIIINRLAGRVSYLNILLPAFAIPIVIFFVTILRYTNRTASLPYWGKKIGPEEIDEEYRVYGSSFGCERNYFTTVFFMLPDSFTLKALIKLFGYQKGSYDGFIPKEKDILLKYKLNREERSAFTFDYKNSVISSEISIRKMEVPDCRSCGPLYDKNDIPNYKIYNYNKNLLVLKINNFFFLFDLLKEKYITVYSFSKDEIND